MKTNIILIGLGFDKPEIVEQFNGTEAELVARLKNLQSGYCEDEKPVIRKFSSNERNYIEAVSDADYSHVALGEKK